MKSIIACLFVCLLAGVAKAETYNTRILLHGQKEIGQGFGVGGWVIAPNITSSPSTWITIVGPMYKGQGWSLELMAGAVMSDGSGKFLLDTRFEITPKLWDVPVYSWHNLKWICTGGAGTLYWYSQLDYVLPPLGLGLLVWKPRTPSLVVVTTTGPSPLNSFFL